MNGKRVGAIVLAAGASKRLGTPKQLVSLSGERLLERAVRVAREAGCAPVVVVLGAASDEILRHCTLGEAVQVENSRWAEGMATSIRAGLDALGDVDGVVVMACDQPAVTADHLRALSASGEVMASSYAGRRGVPAYIPAALFAQLRVLEGDVGARGLLKDAQTVALPGGEVDVDSAEDIGIAKRLFEGA